MSTQNPIIAVHTRSGYPSSNVQQGIPDYANTNVNTLILSGPNGSNGGIVYNKPPYTMFNEQGQYVGDASWPASLAQLIAATNISPSGIDSAHSACDFCHTEAHGLDVWRCRRPVAAIGAVGPSG